MLKIHEDIKALSQVVSILMVPPSHPSSATLPLMLSSPALSNVNLSLTRMLPAAK